MTTDPPAHPYPPEINFLGRLNLLSCPIVFAMLRATHSPFKKFILYLRGKLSARQFFIMSSVIIGISSGLIPISLKYLVHTIESLIEEYGRNDLGFIYVA